MKRDEGIERQERAVPTFERQDIKRKTRQERAVNKLRQSFKSEKQEVSKVRNKRFYVKASAYIIPTRDIT